MAEQHDATARPQAGHPRRDRGTDRGRRRQRAAATAIYEAREAGATKTALREVATKDHWDFEGYLKLGEELAQ